MRQITKVKEMNTKREIVKGERIRVQKRKMESEEVNQLEIKNTKADVFLIQKIYKYSFNV